MAKDLEFVGLIIAVDRQEVGKDGRDAIGEFEEKTKVPVYSIITALDIIGYLKEKGDTIEAGRIEEYLKRYGTEETKKVL